METCSTSVNSRSAVTGRTLVQQRGFVPGHEDEDWLKAERQIRKILCEDL